MYTENERLEIQKRIERREVGISIFSEKIREMQNANVHDHELLRVDHERVTLFNYVANLPEFEEPPDKY